jgi:predicted nucleic acid-binding protein
VTSGTIDKTFVDTNVLIYAHDIDAGRKHDVAKAVLRDLWAERAGVLSTQVLQEFYVNATRKLKKPLARQEALSRLCREGRLQSADSKWRLAKARPEPDFR